MHNTTTPRARQARIALALALGLGVAAMGYITSFANLTAYAANHHFAVPAGLAIGLDIGILALLLIDSVYPSAFARWSAWVITAGTVAANAAVTPDGDVASRALHAALPAIAVVFLETFRRLRLREDSSRMDRVRWSRYLVNPVRTTRLRARMISWEVTSYAEALRLESAILTARTVICAEYGQRSWRRTRRRVPVILVHQLATGQLPHSVLHGLDLQTAVRDWVRDTLAELDPVRVAVPEPDPEVVEEAWWDRCGTGPQEAVREMVQEALADLAPGPDAIPEGDDPPEAVSEAVSRGAEAVAERDPWDRVWDRLDSLDSGGLTPDQIVAAYGLARRHHEQVGRHIVADRLRGPVGIGKPKALTLARFFQTAYETEADPRSPQRSEDPGGDHPADPLPETGAGPDGTTGPVGGPVPARATA